jgi:hypothetical protein
VLVVSTMQLCRYRVEADNMGRQRVAITRWVSVIVNAMLFGYSESGERKERREEEERRGQW